MIFVSNLRPRRMFFFTDSDVYNILLQNTENWTIMFVFEWKIFPSAHYSAAPPEIQTLLETELRIQPQDFENRII